MVFRTAGISPLASRIMARDAGIAGVRCGVGGTEGSWNFAAASGEICWRKLCGHCVFSQTTIAPDGDVQSAARIS